EFKSDEAGIVRQALALVHEGQFPLVGPGSSQGPAHPPLQIYLTALPLSVTQDPRLAVAVVALIHTAAVGMAYWLGARFFQRRVGLMAALLFAVNPWAIYYARKMWTQNWPLATTLFIASLLLLVVERRPWALVGACLALIPLVGAHLGGLAFVAVLALVLLLFPSRAQRRPLLIGASVLVLFALPYLYHDATHDWSSLRGLLGPGDGAAQIDLQAARFAAWLSSGYHYQDLAGARHIEFLDGLPGLRWLDGVEMALLGLGLLYLALRVARYALEGRERWSESAGRDVILLSWLLIPVLLQSRHTLPVYPHYFILLYPVQHLLIALLLSDGLGWLQHRFNGRVARWSALGLIVLLLTIGGWQVYVQQTFIRFVARYDTPDGYGPVVGPLWQAASAAGDAASADGGDILVISPSDDPLWGNLASALDVLLPRHLPHRLVNGHQALVFPMRAAVYVVTPGMVEALAALRAQPGAVSLAEIPSPGDGRYWVFRRSNESRDDVLAGMAPLDPPLRLANGVELLAYRFGGASQAGGTVHLVLAWWLYDGSRLPAPSDYHAFAHLVDAAGQRWGQHDLLSFPSVSWRAGDLVLTRFQIETQAETPPGEYWVNLGMYSYPDLVAAPVLDVAGNPAADFTVVGPLELHR
ncbi:MAG: glycosyltransferase family 39 protein, partial [Anaerolineae bacterium]